MKNQINAVSRYWISATFPEKIKALKVNNGEIFACINLSMYNLLSFFFFFFFLGGAGGALQIFIQKGKIY